MKESIFSPKEVEDIIRTGDAIADGVIEIVAALIVAIAGTGAVYFVHYVAWQIGYLP